MQTCHNKIRYSLYTLILSSSLLIFVNHTIISSLNRTHLVLESSGIFSQVVNGSRILYKSENVTSYNYFRKIKHKNSWYGVVANKLPDISLSNQTLYTLNSNNSHKEDYLETMNLTEYALQNPWFARPPVQRILGNRYIAIGGAITSKGIHNLTLLNFGDLMPLFTVLLPSFCLTASKRFTYHFYWVYDDNDLFFNSFEFRSGVTDLFYGFIRHPNTECGRRNLSVNITLTRCGYHGKPAWAQNDAMIEAYLDDKAEFFYRINDDTVMVTNGWSERFVECLQGLDPPYIGVTGPTHSGGKSSILTYDFVQLVHFEIFGYYYPRMFSGWYADDWITQIYRPNRTVKLSDVRLTHKRLQYGTRYKIDRRLERWLQPKVKSDTRFLTSYLTAVRTRHLTPSSVNVIVMWIYGSRDSYTFGVIRNVQLAAVHFPDWKIVVYVPSSTSKLSQVPTRIINKLIQLGVRLVEAPDYLKPSLWPFLIIWRRNIDRFIVRASDSRISSRDSVVVSDWMATNHCLHCIHDLSESVDMACPFRGWGGQRASLHKLIREPWSKVLVKQRDGEQFLNQIIWPLASAINAVLTHDRFSSRKWPNSMAFSTMHTFPIEHIGEKHKKFGELT